MVCTLFFFQSRLSIISLYDIIIAPSISYKQATLHGASLVPHMQIIDFIIQFLKERAEYSQEREKYETVFG